MIPLRNNDIVIICSNRITEWYLYFHEDNWKECATKWYNRFSLQTILWKWMWLYAIGMGAAALVFDCLHSVWLPWLSLSVFRYPSVADPGFSRRGALASQGTPDPDVPICQNHVPRAPPWIRHCPFFFIHTPLVVVYNSRQLFCKVLLVQYIHNLNITLELYPYTRLLLKLLCCCWPKLNGNKEKPWDFYEKPQIF